MLPRFDTGHWSRYSLGGRPTSTTRTTSIDLLKLARPTRTGDPVWADAVGPVRAVRDPAAARDRPDGDAPRLPAARGRRPRLARLALLALEALQGRAHRRREGGRRQLGCRWLAHDSGVTPRGLAAGSHAVRLVASSADGNPGETDLGSVEGRPRRRRSPLLAGVEGRADASSGARRTAKARAARIRIVPAAAAETKVMRAVAHERLVGGAGRLLAGSPRSRSTRPATPRRSRSGSWSAGRPASRARRGRGAAWTAAPRNSVERV